MTQYKDPTSIPKPHQRADRGKNNGKNTVRLNGELEKSPQDYPKFTTQNHGKITARLRLD